MMRGGWRGGMGTAGGITRTYGLRDHFSKPDPRPGGMRLSRTNLRRILRYFRPYAGAWCLILLCIAVAAALAVLPPLCVGMILDRAIPDQNLFLLGALSSAMVMLAVISGLVSVLQQTLTARAGQSIMFDLRRELFEHLQRMSLRFYTATRSGEIVSRVNNDVNAVQGVAMGTLVTIASNLATLLATSITLLSMNWRLTLMAVVVVPLFYLPSRIVGRVRRRLSAQTQEHQANLLAFLSERLHVGGLLLTSIYGRRVDDAHAFDAHAATVRDLNIRQAVVGRWLFMILSVFSALGPAMIYWYGGYQVIQEQLTPGLLVAFAALLSLLYRPLVQLATVYVDIQASVAVFDRIFEYLDMRPDVSDQDQPRELGPVRGHIRVEGVTFTYPLPPAVLAPTPAIASTTTAPAEEAAAQPEDALLRDGHTRRFAIEDVSFEIEPGQRVALVGPSGAGKTTLTYLVPRFYDPDHGRIFIDGIDLRELRQEDLRQHIGIVTQETFLFHASIRDNLLYARPDATTQQMHDACTAANIHDFIMGLPEGYDTIVGERGFRLSGGEKQRLSIARALLKDPAMLILDEATSSLDATSEHLIQTALEVLLAGRTSLIIAHRLSTILGCDRIVVLEAGRVVDIGTHAQLLERGGLYAELFRKQFGQVLDMQD